MSYLPFTSLLLLTHSSETCVHSMQISLSSTTNNSHVVKAEVPPFADLACPLSFLPPGSSSQPSVGPPGLPTPYVLEELKVQP